MFSDLRYRLRSFFRRERVEAELDNELLNHLDYQTEKYVQSGFSPEQALRRAKIDLGGLEQTRQQSRDARGTRLFEDLVQDVRYGLRTLRKSPAFTATTVLTLALGIGASAAIFSLLYAVLLRSLPYGDSGRLVYLYLPIPRLHLPPEIFGPSNADFVDIKSQSRSYENLTLFDQGHYSLALAGSDIPAQGIAAAKVDGEFFATLQAQPMLGRAISVDDNEQGRDRVVVIGHALWQSGFAERADILTQSLLLDGKAYRIIGVMPPAFEYPHNYDLPYGNPSIRATQIWIPLALGPRQLADRDRASANAVARLKSGVGVREAQAELGTIAARLDPLHDVFTRGITGLVGSFNETAIGPVRPLLYTLLGAVSFVLLIACANAASLLFARGAARTHEIGVRSVLGAARARIVRQLLTESLLLGMAAGGAGMLFAWLFLRLLLRLSPSDVPRLNEASLNLPVLVFAVALTLLTSVLFGLLPAISATRFDLIEPLKAAGNRAIQRGRTQARSALFVFQVALVFVLLAGAGLLVRSYINVASLQTGFSESTVGMKVRLDPRYATREQRAGFFRDLIERISRTPGVLSVGAVSYLPLSGSESLSTFTVPGYDNQRDQLVETRGATAGYFSAMEIPVLYGRLYNAEDVNGKHPVVLVNEAFVERYLRGSNAVGRAITVGAMDSPPSTVVGVLGNIRNLKLEDAPPPQVYVPFEHDDNNTASFAIRSSLPEDALVAVVRAAVRSMDPSLAIGDVRTMGDLVSEATARRRFQTTLLMLFAGAALFLAAVGFYGLMAYTVKQRTGEIGVRMALGASRPQIRSLIVERGMRLVIAGLVIGFAGAVALTRLLAGFLYGVRPLDPVTMVGVAVVLAGTTLTACTLPANRASRIEPTEALRSE